MGKKVTETSHYDAGLNWACAVSAVFLCVPWRGDFPLCDSGLPSAVMGLVLGVNVMDGASLLPLSSLWPCSSSVIIKFQQNKAYFQEGRWHVGEDLAKPCHLSVPSLVIRKGRGSNLSFRLYASWNQESQDGENKIMVRPCRLSWPKRQTRKGRT